MRNEYQDYHEPAPINKTPEISPVAQEIKQLQESVERSESEARQTRSKVEQYEQELLSHGRRSKGMWAAVIILACALIGVTWYQLPQLWDAGKDIGGLMSMQDVLSAAQNKVSSMEVTLTDLADSRNKLADRVARVEKTAGASLGRVRTQAQVLIGQAEQRMRAEMNEGLSAVQSRFATIESAIAKEQTAQDADRARLASLQADVANMHQEIASNKNFTDQHIADVRQNADRNYSDLSQRVASNRSDFDSLTNRLGQVRTDFEIPEDQVAEVIPGLRLNVNHTDTGHQRVDAWMQVIGDGNTLWVKGQGIEQPVSFYSPKEARAYQVVFTRVNDHNAVGYVLTPNPNPAAPSNVAAASTSKTSDN
jgi:predicted  nucleic acid-binding Zn-ribbon protein